MITEAIIQSPLLAGIIGGSIVAFFQNSSYLIRKKTKAETKQKLELGSIIEVINGTKELKLVVAEHSTLVISMAGTKVGYLLLRLQGNSQIDEEEDRARNKLEKDSKEHSEKISNFIFLLTKDMVINGEDEAVRKEIEKIKEIHKEINKAILNLKMIGVNELRGVLHIEKEIRNKALEIGKKFEKQGIKINKAIDESIEKILEIYKARLN